METGRYFLHLVSCPVPEMNARKITVGICFGVFQDTFQKALGLSRYEFGGETAAATGLGLTIEPTFVASMFEYISGNHRECLISLVKTHIDLQLEVELWFRTIQTRVSARETIRKLDNLKLKLRSLVKTLRSSGTQRDEFKRHLASRERAITREVMGFRYRRGALVMIQDIIDFIDGLDRAVAQDYIDIQDLDEKVRESRQKKLEMGMKPFRLSQLMPTSADSRAKRRREGEKKARER
jgi:hypothetical protein